MALPGNFTPPGPARRCHPRSPEPPVRVARAATPYPALVPASSTSAPLADRYPPRRPRTVLQTRPAVRPGAVQAARPSTAQHRTARRATGRAEGSGGPVRIKRAHKSLLRAQGRVAVPVARIVAAHGGAPNHRKMWGFAAEAGHSLCKKPRWPEGFPQRPTDTQPLPASAPSGPGAGRRSWPYGNEARGAGQTGGAVP